LFSGRVRLAHFRGTQDRGGSQEGAGGTGGWGHVNFTGNGGFLGRIGGGFLGGNSRGVVGGGFDGWGSGKRNYVLECEEGKGTGGLGI